MYFFKIEKHSLYFHIDIFWVKNMYAKFAQVENMKTKNTKLVSLQDNMTFTCVCLPTK